MMTLYLELFIGLLLISLGILVHLGKKHDYIAGYNTMDEIEKSAFNIEKYDMHFGITFYLMGIVLILYSLGIELYNINDGYFVFVMLIVIAVGVGYLNLMGQIIKRQ